MCSVECVMTEYADHIRIRHLKLTQLTKAIPLGVRRVSREATEAALSVCFPPRQFTTHTKLLLNLSRAASHIPDIQPFPADSPHSSRPLLKPQGVPGVRGHAPKICPSILHTVTSTQNQG